MQHIHEAFFYLDKHDHIIEAALQFVCNSKVMYSSKRGRWLSGGSCEVIHVIHSFKIDLDHHPGLPPGLTRFISHWKKNTCCFRNINLDFQKEIFLIWKTSHLISHTQMHGLWTIRFNFNITDLLYLNFWFQTIRCILLFMVLMWKWSSFRSSKFNSFWPFCFY